MAKSQEFQNDMCVTTHTSARVLVLLGNEGQLSTKELNAHLSCSYSTTRRRLLRLAELGMVTRQKEEKIILGSSVTVETRSQRALRMRRSLLS